MANRYKRAGEKRILFLAFKAALFILLAVVAFKAGMMAGDVLYNLDIDIIGSIGTENFKSALNFSLPVIDSVYNSGNISVSFASELKNLVRVLFGFDLSTPVTVLNSQTPIFKCFYDNNYRFRMARNKAEEEEKPPDTPIGEDSKIEFKEDASSTSYEEESEGREIKEERIIRGGSGNIVLHNETNYKINIDDLLKEPLNIKFDKKGPKILIYHTHTSEGYLKSAKEIGKEGIPSWSQNPQYSVVRVGEELAQILRKKYGVEVVHNGTVHDYPSYNGSYSRSLNTVSKILKSYPSIKIVLDIHRDGFGGSNQKLRAVTKLNGRNAAQVMFVVGSDQSKGLNHPNWRENLKFALKLQEKLNEISPGLTKPINLSKNRYNQHVSNGALIIEIGGDGNTLEEGLESAKYVAKAINDVINAK